MTQKRKIWYSRHNFEEGNPILWCETLIEIMNNPTWAKKPIPIAG
jgi:hypothetical protein